MRGDDTARLIPHVLGNRAAASQSSGPGVFRPASGYQGVWHLNESANNDSLGYRDATGNANHGTGKGMSREARVAAPAGNGQHFQAPESYINAGTGPTLHADSALTLEAWVKADTFTFNKNLLSRAAPTVDTPFYEYAITFGDANNFRFTLTVGNANVEVYSARNALPNLWYRVSGTYDGSMVRLFVNGAQVDSLKHTGRITGFNRPLQMAHYEYIVNTYPLRTSLDELRVSSRAHSPDQIKLSYENQRPGSTLLRFEPD